MLHLHEAALPQQSPSLLERILIHAQNHNRQSFWLSCAMLIRGKPCCHPLMRGSLDIVRPTATSNDSTSHSITQSTTNSTIKKNSCRLHYFSYVYTAFFRARGEIYVTTLNILLLLISHEEFIAHFLYFAAFYTDCYGQPGLPRNIPGGTTTPLGL